jgi:alginate O-acetyltransferase complex protein AlgI
MLFNSWIFGVFFALFFPIYLLVRRDVFRRNVLLIVASYFFYGWWDPRFLILVAVSTSVDFMAALGAAGQTVSTSERVKAGAFLLAVTVASLAFAPAGGIWISAVVVAGIGLVGIAMRVIDRAAPEKRRKYWLLLSLTTNLGILGFFKYFNFFASSLTGVVALMGISIDEVTLSIILPVGLSFYTFQAISRTIDCYRGVFTPAHSITNYAAYHAFFPQLVAGPIERAAHLMPQFESVRPLNREMFVTGFGLFLWGLFQKMVVADNVAPIANAAFADPSGQTSAAMVAGILAFTFQIYCDFAGYSNMARGIARCLGFDLMVNFNLPYFARTPSEFWQRWHISLSSWLRDYLYIPLGGNRHGTAKLYRNLMLTMLIGGLWHGAGWTFVAWGAFHGAIQVMYRSLRIDQAVARANSRTIAGIAVDLTAWFCTMVLVMIGWVFFRAHSFENSLDVMRVAFGTSGYAWSTFSPLLTYIAPLVLVEVYQRFSNTNEVLNVGPFLWRYTARMTAILALIVFSARAGQQFIYFDF